MNALALESFADALGKCAAEVKREIRLEFRADLAEMRLENEKLRLELRAIYEQERQRLADALALIKDGRDGKDGVDGINGKDGDPGRDGIDGKDGADGRAGTDGKDGAPGAPGRDGVDGKDGAAGTEGPQGKEGTQGAPGREGRDGMNGLQGERGEPGKNGRDGSDGIHGKDGKDGLGFDDMEEEIEDGGRVIVRRYRSGDRVKEFRHVTAATIYRGVWHEGLYLRGDQVSHGGSTWTALKDTKSKPETSDDWQLSAKRGQHGKDGKPGADGKPGPKGDPGRDVTKMDFSGNKY